MTALSSADPGGQSTGDGKPTQAARNAPAVYSLP